MSLRVLALLALLSSGCVPMTEPVGDIDKAEPDKNLVGWWQGKKGSFWVVDCPEVKGNPKGLMRAMPTGKEKKIEAAEKRDICWFFLTTIGKHTYANVLLVGGKNLDFAQVEKEGEYAKWTKNEKRGYGVMLLKRDGDTITAGEADETAIKTLMKANQFPKSGDIYKTPPGWLTKHLEKNGPEGLFEEFDTFIRVKN